MRTGLLLLAGCAALRPVRLQVPDADAEKKQAALDYEFGENEKAQDPEKMAADDEATKTAQLESKLKAQRTWEAPEEKQEDSVIHKVIDQEKADTLAKTKKEKEVQEAALTKAKKVDEASLDAQFGENEKTADVEQEEIDHDLKRGKSLAEKVQSEHKWIAA